MDHLDRYTVIGHPVAHSKSPEIHARFAAQTGQHLDYQRLLAPLDGFAAALHAFIRAGGKGANVTLPFKLEAHAVATVLSARAQAAGAVNTLTFDGDAILGDNTDGVGLVADIKRCGIALADRRVLLLGAGGAARGAILPLLQEMPGELLVANRTAAKAADLAQRFAAHGPIRAATWTEVKGQFDVVINATSASLAAELPPVPAETCGPGTFAYDMMYGRRPTVFMQFAEQRGAAVRDGLGMLIEQAAEAFHIWRGVRPDTAPVLAAIRAML